MNVQPIRGAKALAVSINVRREAGGFFTAHVHREVDGLLIVLSPPCDTAEGSVEVARAMYRHGRLAIPDTLPECGSA
ncbi:hypothetical protein Q8W71_30910 [Methylobacterium sp. NEAU 140]|uniref:hypothetical protein n=1 Tax=Methylobacterium sp. NEAU 140 TaxID=3064945 RepID=UPI002736E58E|nr:hypothetical protein [Methylobacterium sp. NEAU 140]MDP4027003.1 hypothetical protein [Methylobacterium sp. NEAU 140]